MIVEITKNDDDTRTVCLKHSVAFESDVVPMRDFMKRINEVYFEFMYQNPFFSNKIGVIKYNEPTIMLTGFQQQYIEQKIVVDLDPLKLKEMFPNAIIE